MTSFRQVGWPLGLGLLLVGGVGVLFWALVAPQTGSEPEPGPGPVPELVEADRPLQRTIATPEPVVTLPSLEDLAQELAGDEGVVCRVTPAVEASGARLSLTRADGTAAWLAVAAVQGHVLVLSDIPENGRGSLQIEGFAPAEIAWTDARGGAGRCAPDPLELKPADAAVVGSVIGPSSAAGVTACGQAVRPDAEGDFYAAASPGERCVVEARRHFGVWEWVDRVEVTPERGRDVVVEVEVPDFEAVLPLVVEDGRIRAVWDDAVEASLTGLRVVQVDGREVPGDADGFHLATGGGDGVPAIVAVRGEDGGAFEVEMMRRKLGFEDWLVR